MYARQQTWIENGPGLGDVVIPLPGGRVLKYRRPGRRGVGDAVTKSNCLWGSPFDSSTWADCYDWIQYGGIPRVATLPLPPAPNAPQTLQQMSGGDWGVNQSGVTPDQWDAWAASQRAALSTDPNWNPGGNLPVTADGVSNFFDKYGSWLLVGGLAVGGLVLYGAVRR